MQQASGEEGAYNALNDMVFCESDMMDAAVQQQLLLVLLATRNRSR
jgi:hypothetical protein